MVREHLDSLLASFISRSLFLPPSSPSPFLSSFASPLWSLCVSRAHPSPPNEPHHEAGELPPGTSLHWHEGQTPALQPQQALQSPLFPTGGRERCHGELLLTGFSNLPALKSTDTTSVHIPLLETCPSALPSCEGTWEMQALGREPSCRINSISVNEEHEFLVDKSALGSN